MRFYLRTFGWKWGVKKLRILWRPEPNVVAVVKSVNDVAVRLTEERWLHIVEFHRELEMFQPEVLLTVGEPDRVYFSPAGLEPNFAAVKVFSRLVRFGLAKNLVVHYKELPKSSEFILTAFVMSTKRLNRRFRLWQRLM